MKRAVVVGAWGWLLTAAWPGARCTAEPAPAVAPADEAAALVKELGAESFQAREKATYRLARLGLSAKEALLGGLASDDAEVRLRCRRVLEVVLDLDFRDRIQRFADDTQGLEQHDLPCWDEFRKLVGDSPQARGLFVEVLEAEPHLVEVLAHNPASIPEMVAQRTQQLQNRRAAMVQSRQQQDVPLGTLVALLFIVAHPAIQLPEPVQNTVISYLSFPAFQQAVNNGPRVELLKSMLAAFIVRGQGPPYQLMNLALRYQIAAGVDPALSILDKQEGPPQIRMQALLVVGRFGDRSHIAAVEALLDDEQGVNYRVNGAQVPTQVRDVALAVLLKLTEQPLADYGFERAQANPQLLFNIQSLGFTENEARLMALEKWAAWRVEHAAELPPAAASKASDTP